MRLLDTLRRLDEHVVPRFGRTLGRVHMPRWTDRIGDPVNDYMASSPWRDRFEQKLYVALVVGTFAVLWVPLVIVDAVNAPPHSTTTSGGEVDRVTDGILFVVAVLVATVGVTVSRRWRKRRP